jgi:uncharacterized phage protein gp47/JayE
VAEITVKTRDQIIADYERNYRNRSNATLTGPGTPVRRDAVLVADALVPIYANCSRAGRGIPLDGKDEGELRQIASDASIPLSGATGSSGYVTITAASTGTTIFAGDELIASQLVYYCTTTAHYLNEQSVPVAARSTGPATNLDAGTKLQWKAPRAGCATLCTVTEQTDGSGLNGGADADGREQIIAKIRAAKDNPPAAGNNPHWQDWIKSTPGVQIQEAFIYACADGPAVTAWCFTVAPNKYGSRIPTAAQVSAVRNHVYSKASKSDIAVDLTIVEEPIDIVIGVDWETADEQWSNEATWPQYHVEAPVSGSGAIRVGTVTSSTAFQLVASNGDYTTCGAPVTGTVIGVYDAGGRAFRRKTVLTVSGTGPWDVTCESSYGSSDTTYAPQTGQRVMPWSDGLSQFVAPVIAAFDAVGPGEIQPSGYLDGQRGRRYPESPKKYPNSITKQLELTLESLGVVSSLDLLEGGGVSATVSDTPNLLVLDDLAAFPRP